MLANKLLLILALAGVAGGVLAQPMTVGEAVQKQSEIARVELDVRLEEMRKKLTGAVPAAPIMTEAKEADELLTLVSVYGIGKALKADFLFRGAIVTMTPGGSVGAVGWRLESLTATQAVLVKKEQNVVVRRSTLYLEGVRADRVYGKSSAREEVVSGSSAAPVSQVPSGAPVAASSPSVDR